MAEIDPSLVGSVLGGRYRLESARRAGATSTVYVASDLQVARTVAVKLISPSLSRDEDFSRRFREAAEVAASFVHPNIVRVEDWGHEEVNGQPYDYLVLEHLSGGSLQDIVDRGRLLSASQVLTIGLDVCRGLDHAHKRGIVHQDIRPGTIMFGEDRRARVADLGLAGMLAEGVWADPTTVDLERAQYASPEQGQGLPVDDKTDVYSLCLTLVEAVTGQLPFQADSTVATLSARVDRLMPVSADLGPLAAVFERAGRPHPAERSTAAEFGRGLVQAAENLPHPAPLPIVGTVPFDPAASTSAAVERRPAPPSDPGAAAPAATTFGEGRELTIRDEPSSTPPAKSPTGGGKRAVGWLVGALLVTAAVIGGVLVWRSQQSSSHEVPPLVGMEAGAAQNLIGEFGWDVTVVEEASDDQELGRVVRTDPAAGASVEEGDAFTLVISSGPTPSALVDLTGMTLEEATAQLTDLGLVLEVGDQPFDETVELGRVMSWDVPDQPGQQVAGDEVLKGTTVRVVASAGPAPRVVPDLINVPFEEAQGTLTAANLVVRRDPDVFSDSVPVGAVAQQSVAPGTEVPRDSEVAVAVSKGPDVVAVPSFAGLDFAGVQNAIVAAGLQVGTVAGDTNGALVGVLSNGQNLGAGDLLPRGSKIDLLYF